MSVTSLWVSSARLSPFTHFYFLFLLLCWVLKHFRLSIFGPFLPVGLCWGLHWRSRCAFFGAHSGPALLWPVLGRVQWQCDTFPTMLGWRRGSICLFHVLFCCFGWFFSCTPMRQNKGWTDEGPVAEGETLLRQMVAQWWLAVIYSVFWGTENCNCLAIVTFFSLTH